MQPATNSSDRDFVDVTEVTGDHVSQEQVDRMCHRYYWAREFCEGKDVLEIACGSGQGLGYLRRFATRISGGDISTTLLDRARRHYGNQITLTQLDAHRLPFPDAAVDVVILFEAIYYLKDIPLFLTESKRVLRPGGVLLIATANKDLEDFNPSPHSHTYLGAREMEAVFQSGGFSVECFGHMPVKAWGLRQRVLRPIKRFAASTGLMPKSKRGKQLLKRFVFGKLVGMPAEIEPNMMDYEPPERLRSGEPDRIHKVLYCAATANR